LVVSWDQGGLPYLRHCQVCGEAVKGALKIKDRMITEKIKDTKILIFVNISKTDVSNLLKKK
uniref:Uncharacterized protein n=1 Tax=Oryctolagus cuniculus TaxID=9986 RepID=A0A5F9CQB1_RABIT